MAKILKNITVDWTWIGDSYALKGFNIAITPSTGTPLINTVVTGTAYGDTRTHTFDNIVLDDTLQYTAWVQAIYKDKNSPWINTANFAVSDNGSATIETKSSNVANTWTMNGDTTKIDGGKIYTGTITADSIGAKQITADHLSANSIDTNMLTANAITTDHIKAESITGDKLAVNSITATHINTDAIESKHIKAGAIEANKINAYGLSIRYQETNGESYDTLTISEDGQVSIAGKVSSFNFNSASRTGWRISPDGDAEFNDAVVRGRIELPNAGVTNDYDANQVIGRNLLLGSDIPVSNTNYPTNGYTLTSKPVVGETYTISMKGILGKGKTHFVIYNSGGSVYLTSLLPSDLGNDGVFRTSFEWINTSGTTTATDTVLYVYPVESSTTATSSIEWIKLEKGTKSTSYTPAPEDDPNPVRFWAGVPYEFRNTAPLKIYQDGSIEATKGIFGGTFTGRIAIGNIVIEDNTSDIAPATFIIGDNNNNPIIRLAEDYSTISTPFSVGSSLVVNPSSSVGMFGVPVSIGVDSSTPLVNFPNSISQNLIEFNSNEYNIVKNSSTGALQFRVNKTNNGSDFVFSNQSSANGVAVEIDGELIVNDNVDFGKVYIKKQSYGIDFIVT